jgi:hypothetical protein
MASVRPAAHTPLSRAAPATPYVPLRHPGVPRRWDRTGIVAALREWIELTGAAPRRQDWSGERAGSASRAQRRWMAEHPRWPSSSCVAGHFGSWSAALEAAGVQRRIPAFESSIAERVETARRLAAAGRTLREIAERLGVSVSSAGNYLRAGTCPDCGGPVTNPRASRCSACTVRQPTIARVWTRAAVREAIRDWLQELGHAPTCRDWTPSRSRPGRWEAESPRWPSAAVVCDLYADHADPWNAALRDAGSPVRFQRWSDDAIRGALAAFWTRTGRAPTSADLRDPAWTGPCVRTLRRHYGGLVEAWEALGPAPLSAGTSR